MLQLAVLYDTLLEHAEKGFVFHNSTTGLDIHSMYVDIIKKRK